MLSRNNAKVVITPDLKELAAMAVEKTPKSGPFSLSESRVAPIKKVEEVDDDELYETESIGSVDSWSTELDEKADAKGLDLDVPPTKKDLIRFLVSIQTTIEGLGQVIQDMAEDVMREEAIKYCESNGSDLFQEVAANHVLQPKKRQKVEKK